MMIQSKTRKKPSISEKVKAVRDYEQSGLSISEYCHQAGIAASTFSKWARQYALSSFLRELGKGKRNYVI